jgi:hypothetical protein
LARQQPTVKFSRRSIVFAIVALVATAVTSWGVLAYARSQGDIFPGTIAPGAHEFEDTMGGSAQYCMDCHTTLPDCHPETLLDPCLRCHVASPGAHAASLHGDGNPCEDCHGTTGSHEIHVLSPSKSAVGALACASCHDVTCYPTFADGLGLSGTGVCDTCHSPGTPYNGVNSVSGSVGAKDNWASGIYDVSGVIFVGKERWCAGCHDEAVGGRVNIVGSGFYTTGHGKPGTPAEECQACHDTTVMDYPLRAAFASSYFYGGDAATDLALCFTCHDYARYFNGDGDNTFGKHRKHVNRKGVSCYACHAASHTKGEPSGVIVLPNNMIKEGGAIQSTSGTFDGSGSCDAGGTSGCHGSRSYR